MSKVLLLQNYSLSRSCITTNVIEYISGDNPTGQLHIVSFIKPSTIASPNENPQLENNIAATGITVIDGTY